MTKVGALVAVASALPLAMQTFLMLRSEQAHANADMQRLLSALAEQVVHDFDGTHRNYLTSAHRLTRLQVVKSYCGGDAAGQRERLAGVLKTFPATDADIRGASILDRTGRVAASSEDSVVGVDLSFRESVTSALAGHAVISNVYLSHPVAGSLPTIAYFAPVHDAAGEVACVAGLFVNPENLWRVLRKFNDRAGPGSYAVIYDAYGVRIAHSISQELLYRPSGNVEPGARDRMVAEQRFGSDTARMLDDVRPVAQHFERARAEVPDQDMFASRHPVSGEHNHGVAMRMSRVPWTVFYMTPARNLELQRDEIRLHVLAVAGLMLALGILGAPVLAYRMLRPLRSLGEATRRLAAGESSARTMVFARDEVGELAEGFNAMATRLDDQAAALRGANAELEERVRERSGLLQEVVRQRDQLAQSNRDLEAFSSSVSHDLRAPLHSIAGFSNVLAQHHAGGLDERGQHYIARIRAATAQMQELIEAMLRLANVAQQPLKLECVGLTALVNEVAEDLAAAGHPSAAGIHVAPLPEVECDRTLVRQVFHNLLSNACKFTARTANPRIEVGAREASGERVIFVRDNGAGFDMADAAQLFHPFRRLHSSKDFPGIGIGLSIVQRVLERHGGRVWAESHPAAGATFFLAFRGREASGSPGESPGDVPG